MNGCVCIAASVVIVLSFSNATCHVGRMRSFLLRLLMCHARAKKDVGGIQDFLVACTVVIG